MNISPRQKKWLKGGSVFFGALLLIVVVLYYIIAFRLKETIRVLVDKESNGVYTFNASSVKVSLLDRYIKINNAAIKCRDTINTSPHYDVKITGIYLSVKSLKSMILPGQLVIDSLGIYLPQIKVHEHIKNESKSAAFYASDILNVLQKLKSKLRVKSFSIRNGSFDYGNMLEPAHFKSNRISVAVKDFSKDNDPDKNFLSSDDIDLSILNQHWKLPDGLHEISFTNLHFSGSNQFFEIDSCSFTGKDKQGNAFSFNAQKLFFNSTRLTDFYNKEALILDTVLLYKPVIEMEASKREKENSAPNIVSESIKQVLKIINCKYIDIVDGSIQLNKKNSEQTLFASQATNFKIYNLELNRDSAGIKFDSISILQKNISFITKDSLFKLTIEEFAIEQNTLMLRNASYGPTEKNQSSKTFTFKSPLLKLNNIRVESLLEKKLDAEAAELYEPQIVLKAETREKKKKKQVGINEDKGRFYNTLNGLNELVLVKRLHIINGNFTFQSTGDSAIDVQMKHINALVLPSRLFSSDSLIDVKRSLPAVTIGSVHLQLPKVKLKAGGFIFQGNARHNYVTEFELDLSNGTNVKGKYLTWFIFDWDKYHKRKEIQINTMHIKELALQIRFRPQGVKEHVVKELPVIHINSIGIDKIKFDQSGSTSLTMDGEKIIIDSIRSLKHSFTWGNVKGLFRNIEVEQPAFKAKAAGIDLNTQSKSSISKASIQINKPGSIVQLTVPYITADFRLHSSDFTAIDLPSLFIQEPEIHVQKTETGIAGKHAVTFAAKENPATLSIGKLQIQKGKLNYSNNTSADAMVIITGFDIEGENILQDSSETAMFSWKSLGVQLNALHVKKKNTELWLADMDAELTFGKIHEQNKQFNLNTMLALNWNEAKVSVAKADTRLNIDKVSGKIETHAFSFLHTKKIEWKKYLPLLSLNGGNLFYKTKTSSIAANGITYSGAAKNIKVSAFKFTPDADAETYFKQKGWQASYTFLETGNINLSGIYLRDDSVFKASKVIVEGANLTTMVDKRYPFKHGKDKPMLAKMINNLKFPIDFDSVLINNGTIYVREVTEETQREAIIPLEEINAVATQVRNRNNIKDSLTLLATFKLYNTTARHFYYKEAYGDSLSSFALQVRLSPVILPELSAITMPYANISVENGKADTVYADWVGNKYAAAGKMNFIYEGLNVKLMSKKDSGRTTFFGRIISVLANNIAIHKKNDKPVVIFYVRNPEKSVFNYWVKTKLNGVLASVVVLQRKKHLKEYRKLKGKYYLPEIKE